MTPKNIEQIVEEFDRLFDAFIVNNCGDLAPHFLDNDDNEAQRIRNCFLDTLHSYGEYVIGKDIEYGLEDNPAEHWNDGYNFRGAECRKRNEV